MYKLQKQNAIVTYSEVLSDETFGRFISFLDVAPLTVKAYKSGLKRFAEYMAVSGIGNPTREDILNFKGALLEHGRKPSTIALYLTSVKRFFAWAESEKLYANVASGIKAPKISKNHKRDCFSSAQIKDILHSFNRSDREGMRNYAMFALMACCGLRTCEVARAKIEDLQVIAGFPVLYIQGKGKTDKTDFIKLPEQLQLIIWEYLSMRGEVSKSDALFCSESDRNHGQPLTTRTISGVCKTAMINAGFNSNRLTAHSLRHSAITTALLNGEAIQNVCAFARHANISTTTIYDHSVNRLKSTIENQIANQIF